MKDIVYLLLHLLTTTAKMIQPGGSRAVIAENLLLKQQLIIHSRARQRAPNLTTQDRTLLGVLSLLLKPGGKKPGPKGPSKEVINAIVEMKQRNPRYGCPRIAQQINLAFGLDLDKDTVRRVLAVHYKPDPGNRGPSWLTTIGHAKDSLWSVDLFRCESILLKSHWVMVVMDQYTRRIIGFGVHAGQRRWPNTLPYVQRRNFWTWLARTSQFRQRSAVSISSMESEPTSARNRGDQIATACANVTSIC